MKTYILRDPKPVEPQNPVPPKSGWWAGCSARCVPEMVSGRAYQILAFGGGSAYSMTMETRKIRK